MKTVGVVGATGLVGKALLEEFLKIPSIDLQHVVLFSSQKSMGESLRVGDVEKRVEMLSETWLKEIHVWFFAAPPDVSAYWIPIILERTQAICIDGSSAFRMHEKVPLIIPEINIHQLTGSECLIASPNCTTTIALMALYPLHKAFVLERFWVNSYQAASGIGADGIKELEEQIKTCYTHPWNPNVRHFYKPLAFNAIPQIGQFFPDHTSEEETKLVQESKKILNHDDLHIFANCVRIPVRRCHPMGINAEFKHKVDLEQAKSILKSASGVHFHAEDYPTALDYEGQMQCGIGRLRYDTNLCNGLAMWVVGDQLLKGAALNMAQIFQHLLENGK